MPQQQTSEWIFNLILRLAVVICLITLALGLIIGVGPLTALIRSSLAFISFAALGWVVSLVWQAPLMEQVPVEAEDRPADGDQAEEIES